MRKLLDSGDSHVGSWGKKTPFFLIIVNNNWNHILRNFEIIHQSVTLGTGPVGPRFDVREPEGLDQALKRGETSRHRMREPPTPTA